MVNDEQPTAQNNVIPLHTANTIVKLIKDNPYFFILYSIFLFVGFICVLVYSKSDILLWMNTHHTKVLDTFFYYITLIGDGWFVGIMLIPLGFIRLSYSIQALVSYLTTGAIVQVLKKLFDLPRPIKYFGDAVALKFVEGIEVLRFNSFPSGHSASAFSLFLILAVIVKNKYWGIAFFFAAMIVAISRVYTVQHFFIDIYFGSFIGVVFTLSTYRAVEMISQRLGVKWLLPPGPPSK